MKRVIAYLSIFLFISCGIDEYIYLEPVTSGNISVTSNNYATVTLPSMSGSMYFKYFAVYYRIYISGLSLSSTVTSDLFSTVNSTLGSDYNTFAPYINNTSISTSIDTLFANRQYRRITLEGYSIENVLSDNVTNQTIIFDFAPNTGFIPHLLAGGQEYNLQRSSGNGIFNPLPENRYFFNTDELNSSTNATSSVNADVANANIEGTRYTYVALYIVATGIDNNFAPIYSAPAFIGVFSLPEMF